MIKRIQNKLAYYRRFRKRGSVPDFLIIGAHKAGTTSLYNYIATYGRNFLPPEQKELYFFTEHYQKGLNYYSSFFPRKSEDEITGEATPDYLFFHKTPKRVKEALGNIKFVVLMRDPIDRLLSHYNFMNHTDKTRAFDPEPIHKAVRNEKNWFDLADDSPVDFNFCYKYYSYKSRGVYHKQLKRWFRYFPEDHFLILDFDTFVSKTKEVLEQVFKFLGIEAKNPGTKSQTFPVYNKNLNRENDFDPETRKYLENFFDPHNEALYELIGERFNW